MGGNLNAPGPSPTLGSLGPSHQWRHKSRASLQDPPCAHGVAGTPQGEVCDNTYELEFGRKSVLSLSSPDFEQSIMFPTLSASLIDLFSEAGFSKNAMKQKQLN